MLPVEQVKNVIKRKKQNVFPSYIEYTPEMGRKIASHLNVEVDELPEALNQAVRMGIHSDTTRIDKENGIRYDDFGIGWDLIITEGFFIRHHPLENIENYKNYKFPDPDEPNLIEDVREKVRKYKGKYFVLAGHSFVLWEKAYCLRVFQNFLMDMIQNRKFAEELLDKITEYQIELAKRFVAEGVDGGITGDDWGQQSGLIFSPDLWKEMIKPRIAKIWRVYKDAGLAVFHHSCGDVRQIIPDLIEIGLDVLSPVQPQAMPIEELSKKYAKHLSFHGGLSVQKTLPFGTPEDVKREVEYTVEILGAEGGYIIAPAHEMTSDIPLENFDAMMETIKKFQ